jgi:hypothetical protein
MSSPFYDVITDLDLFKLLLQDFFEPNSSKVLTWKFPHLLDCLKKHVEEDSPAEVECYLIKTACSMEHILSRTIFI